MLITNTASLTVDASGVATAIGITSPVDSAFSAAQIKVVVTGLPSDGTVYLGDGVSPVLPGDYGRGIRAELANT